MAHLYDYSAGPPGGTLTSLLDHADFVRITEWAGGLRGGDPMGQYDHGEVNDPRKFYPAASFNIEARIKSVNDGLGSTQTEEDDRIYENFSELKRLLTGRAGELVRLERTAPFQGTTYLDCWQTGDAQPSQDRFTYRWPMKAPHPFWKGIADTGNNGATLTVGGDAPAGDLVIDILTGTNARLTHDRTGDYVEIQGTVPGAGVRINVEEGTCVQITGGADYSNFLRVNTPWWFELDPGANAVTLSTGTYTADWVEQWR